MQVSIPKPCSENWGEMSPTERGAFCQKCAIDVIDFSGKSSQEVKETLKANLGKHMWGRFKKSQLEDLSQAYHIWENQSVRTFQSKFLWACLLAFGMTLFTSCTDSQAMSHTVGEIEMTELNQSSTVPDSTNHNADTTKVIDTPVVETSLSQCNVHELGNVVAIEEPFEEILMGEPELFEEPDSLFETVIPADSIIDVPLHERHPELIMGRFMPPPRFEEFIEDTVSNEIPTQVESRLFDANMFPNPAQYKTSLNLDIHKRQFFTIEMYTVNGTLIYPVHHGMIEKGKQRFDIYLDYCVPGTYLIKIKTKKEVQTLKFNKV